MSLWLSSETCEYASEERYVAIKNCYVNHSSNFKICKTIVVFVLILYNLVLDSMQK